MYKSGASLIPHLNGLQYKLTEKLREDFEKYSSAHFHLEMLPYALSSAHNALIECARLQRSIVERVVSERAGDRTPLVLKPEDRDQLSFMIDTFLEAARRTQNALVPYISRGLSISLKSSLSDVMKDVAQGKVILHPVLDDLLRGYWGSCGSRLKDYRDLSQHHALVSSDARIYTDENGKPGLYLLLPSNPEAKSTAKLEFGNPPVFAFMYIREQFHKLLSITHWVTRVLFDLMPGESKQVVGHILRDPIVLGPGVQLVAHRLFSEEELDKEVSDRVARCEEKYREQIAQAVTGEKTSAPNPGPEADG